MGSFGGFYKGDKKKKKKGKEGGSMSSNTSSAPIFSMPEMIARKKKE